jgi:hypothetical protein
MKKFKLITFYLGDKFEVSADSLDEILSLAIDAFNNSHELFEIYEKDKLLYRFCDIYHLINRRYY